MQNDFVVVHNNTELTVDLSGTYENGGMRAIKLYVKATGEPYTSATQNYPDQYKSILKSNPSVVTLKICDENVGIDESLIKAGVTQRGGAYLGGTGGSVLCTMLTQKSLDIIANLK